MSRGVLEASRDTRSSAGSFHSMTPDQQHAPLQDPGVLHEAGRGSMLLSSVLPGVLVAAVGLVALATYLIHRRWRRTDKDSSYESLGTSMQAALSPTSDSPGALKAATCRRSLRRSTEPVFYGCLSQDRPIDFVVPSLAGSSLGGSAVSLVSSSDANSSPLEVVTGSAASCPLTGDAATTGLLPVSTSLLGGLKPELYRSGDGGCMGPDDGEERSFPESHRGRLWFTVQYEDQRECLELRVLKARNLPSRVCGSVNCCDPFVRIQLLPDERRYQQTKFKKKTCNPVFDESYIFQIPGKALSERVLKLTVLDNDRGKRHNVIGHVLFPLRELDTVSGDGIVIWRDLETKVDMGLPEQGELLIGLCYKPGLERLTVTVLEARGLNAQPEAAVMDTQVKVTFLMENKAVKSKKTSVCKRCGEPKFMESFAFRVAPASLSAASVIIKLSCVAPPHKDRCLGRVVLGSFMFARGTAQQHWTEALAAAPKQLHRWHKLS